MKVTERKDNYDYELRITFWIYDYLRVKTTNELPQTLVWGMGRGEQYGALAQIFYTKSLGLKSGFICYLVAPALKRRVIQNRRRTS
jgi:hypothetical protein